MVDGFHHLDVSCEGFLHPYLVQNKPENLILKLEKKIFFSVGTSFSVPLFQIVQYLLILGIIIPVKSNKTPYMKPKLCEI